MLLLTGATGTVGLPLLRHLTAAGVPVRCLVRDPRRLGAERVRVQIALGDLSDHLSFRHALRGVDTVVHLASVIRDQPGGSIEELAGVATWRLVRAAERAGVSRFVFFSVLGASTRSRARLLRAKAVAERAVIESSITHTIFAPSIVYSPSDVYLTLLGRLSLLPVMPMPGLGPRRISADLGRGRRRLRGCGASRRRARRSGAKAPDTSWPGRRRSPSATSWSSRCARCGDGGRSSAYRCRSCGGRSSWWSCWPARRRLPPGTRRS